MPIAKPGRSRRPADRGARRFMAGNLAVLTLLAAGFVALALLSYRALHADDSKSTFAVSSLPPVTITGPEKTVFDWSKDACSIHDYPDLPTRAYRDANGQVQLVVSHFVNRRMSGPSLGNLRHSCDILLRSHNDPRPARFDDRQWIAAPYTIDGRTVYALLHNEYQGHRHPGRCRSGVYPKCWYNTVTLAGSHDGGRTFQRTPPPDNLVASIPYRYVPEQGPYGLFSPSNIVRNSRDGRYYTLVEALGHKSQRRGACLIRTANLPDPQSWRAWNGSSFKVRFINPYRNKSAHASAHVCTPVSPNEIQSMSSSLAWSTHFDKWLLIGTADDHTKTGRDSIGIFYSLSDDLIHWQRRKLIREVELLWTYRCGDRDPILYPSLLDPNSESRNFETVGKRAWLYFTRLHYKNCRLTQDRDLLRVPVSFH